MSSALKPVLPPSGGQNTSTNSPPVKSLQPQAMAHNVPTSFAQPLSHVPQNLGMTHSSNLSGNVVPNIPQSSTSPGQNSLGHAQNIGTHTQNIVTHSQNIGVHSQNIGSHSQSTGNNPQNIGSHSQSIGSHIQNIGSNTQNIGTHPQNITAHSPANINQGSPINIPAGHVSTNKNVGLSSNRPNLMYHHSNSVVSREEEGTTLSPNQNAAQLMAVHRTQDQGTYSKPQSNGTAPAQLDTPSKISASVSAPIEVKPEPPAALAQNHIPETAKQPIEVPVQVSPCTQSQAQTQGQSQSQPQSQLQCQLQPQPQSQQQSQSQMQPQPQQQIQSQSQEKIVVVTVPLTLSPGSTVETISKSSSIATTVPVPENASESQSSTPTKIVTPKEVVQSKPSSTLKLATTSPRVGNRKRDLKPTVNNSTSSSSAERYSENPKTPVSKSSGQVVSKTCNVTPVLAKLKGIRTSEDERKSKRTRTRTQPYQSPLPELALITKLSTTPASKNNDEKLIVFYKNEFLAVRNAEGGFYVCQAVQNVYKSSLRIRIRWLSQDKNDKTYIPDFYDTTDFDCILTNINMERIEKGKYNLPKEEEERTENILKRALAVESGDAAPSLTEEHPDGLDLSLFRDESQLKKKRKGTKRKSTELLSTDTCSTNTVKKTPDQAKVRKISKLAKNLNKIQMSKAQSDNSENLKKSRKHKASGRAERAKRRGETSLNSSNKTSPVVDQKKAKVLAKVALKTAMPVQLANKNQKKTNVRATVTSLKSASSAPSLSATSTSRAAKKSKTRNQGVVSKTGSTVNTRRSKKTGKK